jgi:hypothetical protein
VELEISTKNVPSLPFYNIIIIVQLGDKMFSSGDSKGNFLEQTKAAREERAVEKKRDNAAVKIQSLLKGFVARKKFRRLVL